MINKINKGNLGKTRDKVYQEVNQRDSHVGLGRKLGSVTA